MPGKIELIITADASNAIKTVKATQGQINNLEKSLPKLEKTYMNTGNAEDLAKVNQQLSEVISLIDRAAEAVSKANPSISELQAKYDILTSSIDSLGREYGGLNSTSLEYLKNLQQEVKAQLDLEKATKKTGETTSWFKKQMELVKNVMGFRIIMRLVNTIANFTKFLSDANKAAAEAEQVFSKLNTVFAETSGAMSKTVELASQIGVATSTAASALSTVGDLLQAQGKTTVSSLSTAYEWVSQFQDIIAFKDINMSLEEFAQNFMSGAAGNLRNFRTFGSIVRESAVNAELAKKGLDKLTGSELELVKMTIRAEMALAQQQNAIGATQREWETMLSVNRRYEEALKTFKEATGEQMKPVTKMWLNLKTYILDVLNAEKKLNDYKAAVASGSMVEAEIPLFGGNFDEKTYLKYRQEMVSELRQASRVFAKDGNEEDTANTLVAIARKYGASQGDLNKILAQEKAMGTAGFRLSDAFMEIASSAVEANDSLVEQNETLRKLEEASIDYANSLDSLMESMQTLRNVSFSGEDWYQSFITELDKASNGEIDLSSLENATSEVLRKVISNAMDDIGNMSSTIPEVIFSEDAMEDILNTRIDAYKELYDIAYSSGKFEQKQLDVIVQGWRNAAKELENYNNAKIKLSEISSNLGGYAITESDLESMRFDVSTYGMSGIQKAMKQLTDSYNIDSSKLDSVQKYFESFGAEVPDEINLLIDEWFDIGSELNNSLKEETKRINEYYDLKERKEKYDYFSSSSSSSKENIDNLKLQILQVGKDEVESKLKEYDVEILKLTNELWGSDSETQKYINEAIKLKKEERDTYIELTEAIAKYEEQQSWEDIKEQFSDSFGEFGTLISSLGSIGDITAGGGDLLTMLIQIVAQTEAFTKTASILSTSILPTLNAFLEPLLPVIDMISKHIQMVVQTVLVPFFPVLQGIASALVVTIGIFNTAMGLIADGVKKTVGYAVKAVQDGINWIVDLLNKLPFVKLDKVSFGAAEWANIDIEQNMLDNLEEMNLNLQAIAGMSMEIADNTSDTKDFDTYAKLLAAKEIDKATYEKWTGMDKYTTQTLSNGVTYTRGNNSYVSVNNLTVQVPEGMTLAEFLEGIKDYQNGHSVYGANAMVS